VEALDILEQRARDPQAVPGHLQSAAS
jgi:hypothetical protein